MVSVKWSYLNFEQLETEVKNLLLQIYHALPNAEIEEIYHLQLHQGHDS